MISKKFKTYNHTLLAKESSIIMPALIFAFHFYESGNAAGGGDKKPASNPVRFRRAAFAALPYILISAAYFMLRTYMLNGLHFPKITFYSFPLDSPFLLYYIIQRITHSFITLAFFLPGIPIKMFFYEPAYNIFFVALFSAAVLFLNHARKSAAITREFKLAAFLYAAALTPTLALLPAPHYNYTPSIFFCMLISCYLAKSCRGASAAVSFTEISSPKKFYLVAYCAMGAISASVITVFFYYAGTYTKKLCDEYDKKYSEYMKTEYYRESKAPAEFYIYDAEFFAAASVPEFRLRRNGAGFKSFFLNTATAPFMKKSEIRAGADDIVVRSSGAPFFSGFAEQFAASEKINISEGTRYACEYYDMLILRAGVNALTGNRGVMDFKITFAGKKSRPRSRILLDANVNNYF